MPGDVKFAPRLIAWELTRACPLACRHCRAAATAGPYEGELSTDECRRVVDHIAAFARPILILTGGEPMLRADVYEIAAYAAGHDLRVVLATCGALLDDASAKRLLACGVSALSISLDGASAATHDALRGVPGAFDTALRAIAAARRQGLPFQVNTTVTRANLPELEATLELAARLGAVTFNPFLLVPTGRGRELMDLAISPEDYERTLTWLAGLHREDIAIRVTCAPHYQRILRQTRQTSGGVEEIPNSKSQIPNKHQAPNPKWEQSHNRVGRVAQPPSAVHVPEKTRMNRQDSPHGAGQSGGCMGGKQFGFISHRGTVQICGFLDLEAGDLRQTGLDLRPIWEHSPLLAQLRDVHAYRGRCGRCEFVNVCGGCRARAFAVAGDYLGEEPFCAYEPGKSRLSSSDAQLLSLLQAGLPLEPEPFKELGRELNITGEETIHRLQDLKKKGLIRRLGGIFDSHALGYVTTLVSARVPEDRIEAVAAAVSELPGVTHNYRRNHAFNLWFTLVSEHVAEQQETLCQLGSRTGVEFHPLSAEAFYKLRVQFDLGEQSNVAQPPSAVQSQQARPPEESAQPRAAVPHSASLDEAQKTLVRLLQDDLPLVARPFDALADRLGWPLERVLGQLAEWQRIGVLRRVAAIVHHRRAGFAANGMAVFDVGDDRVDAAGRVLAARPQVSHCYRRPRLAGFPYNLYAMVHGRAEQDVQAVVAAILQEIGPCPHEVLFSTHEYKKTSMRYFV